ncbi:hemoglobin/transferrin/lactoferrin receptor protein [Ensifer sp. WSM1721]|uniref:TonB-dependent hemoglobin/transferrin/lactoferrin family receptor n=1 Tax=Ensifer sp. WSM1721 TaxID=1041159 RepID=UPI00047C9B78|nr:TonB-dependent hemoglobin/transferrin/lactoferrin family receptor [Ensifer sp. WSM1721]
MLNRHHRLALLACTAFVTLAGTTVSFAQSADGVAAAAEKQGRVTALKKLTIKDGEKEGVADTPLAERVTEEELDDNQISSFEDLGRSLEPGVNFNRTSGSVNIRGLEGPRVLTTIDGIPIPFLDDGARDADGGIDSFDFAALSTIDIVRGTDSSRAGGGALAGAVVLRTLEPEDLIGEGRTWGGIFKFAYDGEDDSLGGSAAVAARYDNTAVLFQGGYKKGHERKSNGEVGGYSMTRTEADPADYDQNNLLFKIRQYTDSGHTFGFTAERFDRDKDIDFMSGQSLTGNYRPGNYDKLDNTRRERLSLDYDFEAVDDGAWFDSASAVVYWQRLLRENGIDAYRSTSVIGEYSRLNEAEEESFGASGYVDKFFDTGFLQHKVTLGGDFAFGKLHQYSSGEDSCDTTPSPTCNFLHTNQSDSPDVDSKKFGIYLQDRISIGDGPFALTPGLRFDWYDYSPQNTAAYMRNPNYDGLPPGQSDYALSPKLLATYQAAEQVELFAQWAMAFRPPTAEELYLNYGAPGSYLQIGNPDLKPETSHGFEVGANLGDDDFGGRVGAFYNRYKNFIDRISYRDPTGTYPLGITEAINRANVSIHGVEVSGHKVFANGVHVRTALAYAYGRDLDTDEALGSVPPLKGVLGVGYATETWGADVILTAAMAVSDKSTNTFKAPGYGIVDVTGWWQSEQMPGLRVNAGVYNIFDKTYWDAVNTQNAFTQPRDYYSEPGRTFKISLTQRF